MIYTYPARLSPRQKMWFIMSVTAILFLHVPDTSRYIAINELNFDSMELMNTIQASFDCSDLENPMGEGRNNALRLDFDRKLKV